MQAVDGKKAADTKPAQVPAGKPEVANEAQAGAKRVRKQAQRGKLALLEMHCNAYRYVAPEGETVEDMSEPDYWNLEGDNLHAGDEIKALAHDRSFVALFDVVDAQPGYAVVVLGRVSRAPALRSVDQAKKLPEGWEIRRAGPDDDAEGWYGIHPASGRKIFESGMPFKSHEDCRRGLLDHAIFAQPKGTKYVP